MLALFVNQVHCILYIKQGDFQINFKCLLARSEYLDNVEVVGCEETVVITGGYGGVIQ